MLKCIFLRPSLSLASSSSRRTICMSKMSTTAGPSIPKFVPIEQNTSISHPDGNKFSLVSYNILAQAYVKSILFPHSPSACLKWKARSQAILTVLKSFGTDFLCLQEVDEYESFYERNMESFGYSSIYIQRSGQKRDGCGIFYKKNRAELIIEEKIDYNDLLNTIQDGATCGVDKDGNPSADQEEQTESQSDLAQKNTNADRGDPHDPRVRLKRDCVGVMAAFKLSDSPGHPLIVANTHLYWDPEWSDVKLAQAKYLLLRLAQFKMLVSEIFDCTPSVVVVGDFNSVPGDQVYHYLVSGASVDGPPQGSSDDVPIPLCSVYAHTRGEPQFTNCTPGFTGTLDYIFFSTDTQLKPVSLLELPESESSEVSGGLPNHHHPSDHLPIGVEFEILP